MFQIFALLLIYAATVNSALIGSSLNILGGCFNEVNTNPKRNELVESPGFSEGKNYKPGSYCKWFIKSPNNTQIELNCEVEIPKGADCSADGLVVSTSGDLSFKDGTTRCGKTSFTVVSKYNKLGVELKSDKTSVGGKFSCKLKAVGGKRTRAVYTSNCDCGWSNQYRIVNGSPTGINQYIFMAGIIDYDQKYIMCGGTLISKKYVLTAAHCLSSLSPETTIVVLGEYDTSTNSETSATVVVRVEAFKSYPNYDFSAKKYDLALIELATEITFDSRIGPACLPITSADWDLVGQVATIMGWGTTEYGGRRSNVLLQTNQNIVDIQECVNSLEGDIDAYTQYCTSGQDTDACQNDSGGPVVWINPNTNRYEIIGIISYGRGCALGYPSVNTKVAPFLQWILDNTQGDDYCALSS